jgi:hypothetical protein
MQLDRRWNFEEALSAISDAYPPGGYTAGPQRNRTIEAWGQLVGPSRAFASLARVRRGRRSAWFADGCRTGSPHYRPYSPVSESLLPFTSGRTEWARAASCGAASGRLASAESSAQVMRSREATITPQPFSSNTARVSAIAPTSSACSCERNSRETPPLAVDDSASLGAGTALEVDRGSCPSCGAPHALRRRDDPSHESCLASRMQTRRSYITGSLSYLDVFWRLSPQGVVAIPSPPRPDPTP